jgi:hypothetical protein
MPVMTVAAQHNYYCHHAHLYHRDMNLFNLLVAVLLLVTQIPPLPMVLQAATQASIFVHAYGSPEIDQIMILMLVSNCGDGPP